MKIKALLYCVKAKPYLYPHFNNLYFTKNKDFGNVKLNGKIVAECDFEVEEIYYSPMFCNYTTWSLGKDELLNKSCLTHDELKNYLGTKDVIGNNGYNGYAIHIKNLHIFDEPRFIQDYSKNANPYNYIENAPQNMMYAYDVKSFNNFEKKILIPVSPQEMCRIANKKQDVLIRKVVLKEMLK